MKRPRPRAHCPRCDESVPTLLPWSGWKTAWRVWVGGAGLMFLTLPFFVWDPCVAQPSVMLYLTAGGILWNQRRRAAVCGRCSLELGGGTATERVNSP